MRARLGLLHAALRRRLERSHVPAEPLVQLAHLRGGHLQRRLRHGARLLLRLAQLPQLALHPAQPAAHRRHPLRQPLHARGQLWRQRPRRAGALLRLGVQLLQPRLHGLHVRRHLLVRPAPPGRLRLQRPQPGLQLAQRLLEPLQQLVLVGRARLQVRRHPGAQRPHLVPHLHEPRQPSEPGTTAKRPRHALVPTAATESWQCVCTGASAVRGIPAVMKVVGFVGYVSGDVVPNTQQKAR
mmetsp:Transcript_881/g.2189  ORF Transcript_881/g.2189 Transcript_881/m.2189 type:complete len:240 (+) Transcript_881:1108-1827(+)